MAAAALAVASCAGTARVATQETEAAPDARTAPVAATPAAAEPAPQAATTVRVAAVGDMMIGTDYPKNHLPDDDGIGFFAGVTPFLAGADIAIGNLEGVLADGGTPAKQCSNPNACYLFRSPTRYAHLYRAAGFDLLSLANNHARDFGEEGRSASMRALDAAGIRHSGRRGEFASFDYKGLQIAFLAFAVTRNSNLVHDYVLAEQTISDHAQRHDIVIVSFHAGAEGRDVLHLPFAEEEYFGEPRGDVVRFARMAVDAGADLVVGHGPHVVRAIERYRQRLIAYSLGNFATYYGISVDGNRGIAPILLATLAADGRFIEGEIVSTQQLRPAGPTVDPDGRALRLVRELTRADIGMAGLEIGDDGKLAPRDESPAQSSGSPPQGQ